MRNEHVHSRKPATEYVTGNKKIHHYFKLKEHFINPDGKMTSPVID